jgi:hypothetical protein
MTKRAKLNLLYTFLLILGWLMDGIGWSVRIEPWEIGFTMTVLGFILFIASIVLLIVNNTGKKKIQKRG